ncbi:alanine--tRNA ligase [bacterium (Candidatus Gribaldobacteria) CG_4_10_14_0_8_um_filter_33_9]|uniref:Alanine--tRNA ligase n=1 Tax=bacterium (Candidatus Gribaldobacteria) CG_4_10_14_0_8_um_filter_33_9 TaxID=2014266 RepID=A0A2M7RMN5_9BACT|nr:MAG: alanine--tRNA ligase [bacterium (Candidatus Gribaldobacteria) CG_4_10_14_0_8_um_filter_33_9]
MYSNEIRQKFLNFFEKRGHKIVPGASLIPGNDPSVLFTTAGMQQFKPYYLGEKSPYGQNVCSCQKCFRTSDIDEVGDKSHLTFFEMLGNFSFNGYFKEEAIKLAYEFLFKELKLPFKNAVFTVFKGDERVPEDKESAEIWKKLGIPENKIQRNGKEDNFWGPTGDEGPCGPNTEIHINGIEVWNLVFNEYFQNKNKELIPLEQKGVDTGMGFERLVMISQKKDLVFETDLFEPIISELQNFQNCTGTTRAIKTHAIEKIDKKTERIIADHIKSSVFLIADGILPSNTEHGYVLRRILRRAIRHKRLIELRENLFFFLSQKIIEIYKDVYPELKSKETDILKVIQNEEEKFEKTLEQGLKEFEQLLQTKIRNQKSEIINGKEVFDLYQSYGFPLELTEELAKEKGFEIDKNGFYQAQKKHQEISRAGAEKKFGGHGITELQITELQITDYKLRITKLHTATHLLHSALRKILGENVKQMGSNITPQRLRFDFSHSQKMTIEEIKKVEDLVNQKIKENLEIKKQEMKLEDALKSGALSFFKEKYPEKVSVYLVGDFSQEICAGPHIGQTSEIGHFKIIKEESCSAGVRRIRAVLE